MTRVSDPAGAATAEADPRVLVEMGCRFRATSDEPATLLLLIQAAGGRGQDVDAEALDVSGGGVETATIDAGRLVRVRMDAGLVDVDYRARVGVSAPYAPLEAPPPPGEVAPALLPWIRPSRYCPSDRLAPIAEARFGTERPAGLVADVAAWVNGHLEYVPGVSDGLTAADETYLMCAGVCRDFAHLAITLLRALGVPARAVAAYAPGLDPPDFHAVVEAHDGVAWGLIDPTGMADTAALVRIATGRDAADIAWATTFGADVEGPEVWARRGPA